MVLLTHIPFGNVDQLKDANINFNIILERFQSSVIAVISAHSHTDQIRFFRDRSGGIFHFNFLHPSITSWSVNEPSFRVYQFSNRGFEDFTQYSFDLKFHN